MSWFEEHVDAEEVENNLLRISNVISLWCKEVSSHRFVFVTPEELQVWEKFFYAGLEACVPLDQESTLKDSAQYSCPPLPNLFVGKMFLEQIEQKMGLLGTVIDGVEPSVKSDKSPPPAEKPKAKAKAKSKRVDEVGDALNSFKKAAAELDTNYETTWIDTAKTAILNPFASLRKFGAEGTCSPAAAFIAARMSLHFCWTESNPGVDGPAKRWGQVRNSIVDYIVAQHPHVFSSQVVLALPSGGFETEGAPPKLTVERFMQEFSRQDAATQRTRAIDEAAAGSEHGSGGSASSKDVENSVTLGGYGGKIERLRELTRLFHDQGVMIRLTPFTSTAGLSTEWGYQVMPQIRVPHGRTNLTTI